MKTQTSTLYIYLQSYRGQLPEIFFSYGEMPNCDLFTYVLVETQQIKHVDVSQIDIRSELTTALEKQKSKVLADAHLEANKIEEKIQSLTAIEHKEVA